MIDSINSNPQHIIRVFCVVPNDNIMTSGVAQLKNSRSSPVGRGVSYWGSHRQVVSNYEFGMDGLEKQDFYCSC